MSPPRTPLATNPQQPVEKLFNLLYSVWREAGPQVSTSKGGPSPTSPDTVNANFTKNPFLRKNPAQANSADKVGHFACLKNPRWMVRKHENT